jgi:tRNA pseudouridine38-40 synthase
MMRNLLFTIEYDGSGFHGWQRQPDVPTVQAALEKALTRLFDQPVEVQGTSRTDAGVHALGQRASFSGEFGIPTDKILFPLNNMLPDSIRVTEVREMPPGFHARHDSRGKTYRYLIKNTRQHNVFDRNYYYYIHEPLDLAAMQEAGRLLEGTHDFKSFQASGGEIKPSTVRTIHSVKVGREGQAVFIEVTGNGFLYNMVRIIAGTLAEVGLGRKAPGDIPGILAALDRAKAGHTAPPQGLYLMQVYYDEPLPGAAFRISGDGQDSGRPE